MYSLEGHSGDVEEGLKAPVAISAIVVVADAPSWVLDCLLCLLVDADLDVAADAGLLGATLEDLVVKSCSDDAVVYVAHTEMVPHELAWEDTVGVGSTSAAEVAPLVARTWLDHVDRDRKARQPMQENWIVGYDKKSEGMV